MAKETGSISWKALELGCTIVEPGNASQLKTGDWRSAYPVTDLDVCIKCGVLHLLSGHGL